MRMIPMALAAVLLLGGCGEQEATPADAVPALVGQLKSIDGLIADRHWGQARAALRALIARTEEARTAGDLEESQADRVIASATRMLAALPAPTPSVTPSPSATPSRTATPPDTSGDGKPDDNKSDKAGDHKGKGKRDD